MTTCRDPYRELELYLEKAQEEIGKAFEELSQHEDVSLPDSYLAWESNAPLLPPPPAFRTSFETNHVRFRETPKNRTSISSVNRVCYDGNIVDLVRTLPSDSGSFRNTTFTTTSNSFFSKIGSNVVQDTVERYQRDGCNYCLSNRKKSYASLPHNPNGSYSNNVGSMQHFERAEYRRKENSMPAFTGSHSAFRNGEGYSDSLSTLEESRRRMRPRSFSETSPPKSRNISTEDRYHTFPRPPSGDVNLLAIWADNLVLEIDKSLSGDMSDCLESPLSNSSLSPPIRGVSIPEESHRECIFGANGVETSKDTSSDFGYAYVDEIDYSMSRSTDSGIDQTQCSIPQQSFSEDCVDASFSVSKRGPVVAVDISKAKEYMSVEDFADNDSITPPPPEFEDSIDESLILSSNAVCCDGDERSVAVAKVGGDTNAGEVRQGRQKEECLLVADTVLIMQDDEVLECELADVHRLARVIPVVSLEPSECATLTTTTCVLHELPRRKKSLHRFISFDKCAVSEMERQCSEKMEDGLGTGQPSEDSNYTKLSSVEKESSSFDGESTTNVVDGHLKDHSSKSLSLPKQMARIKGMERMSNSLPRDSGRVSASAKGDAPLPQRSSSSSAVSSILQVSVEELAAFMSKVKKSTYHPPPRADVCVEVKDNDEEDNPNRDAVTQTTPVFSRSSSFTWVGECDCSDWGSSNYKSGSEESLFLSCSNSEKKTPDSSSPSFPPATSEEEDNIRRCSASSSLSLSACSEKCSDPDLVDTEDFEKDEDVKGEIVSIPELIVPDDHQEDETCGLPLSTCTGILVESPSLGADLAPGGVADEPRSSETLSVDSADDSSSSSLEINTSDTMEHSASFPSTLKTTSKSKEHEEKKHSLEPHVLGVNELNSKSVSAPVLRRKRTSCPKKEDPFISLPYSNTNSSSKDEPSTKTRGSSSLRAHSAKELNNELQAIEACSWLRAAGFPQYAQMYEDNLFPIDICTVQKDHAFLHPDSIQSLFRRLNTLNRCARMKFIDNIPRKSVHMDESDDEEQCALSENWQFQRTSRRWSRVPSPPEGLTENVSGNDHEPPPSPKPYTYPPSSPVRKYLSPEEAYSSSHDSVFIDDQHSSPDSTRRSAVRNNDERYHVAHGHRGGGCSPGSSSGSGGTLSIGSEDLLEKTLDIHHRNLRRSGSDRIKEGARALFRRMESLKGKRKKKNYEEKADHTHDIMMSTSMNSGTDGSSSSSMTPSPQLSRHCRVRGESPHDTSEGSQGGTPQWKHRKKGWGMVSKGDNDATAHSDSECPMLFVSERWKDANCNDTKLIEHYVIPQTSVTITTNTTSREWCMNSQNDKSSIKDQNSSYNFIRQSQHSQRKNWLHPNSDINQDEDKNKRGSYYDNLPAPIVAFNTSCIDNLEKNVSQQESGKGDNASRTISDLEADGPEEGDIIIINAERRDSGVGSSLTRSIGNQQAPWHCFPDRTSPSPVRECSEGISITSLNAPQVLVLRKLSLLKLTTLMEKFSPSSRTGWSWVVPKFIRRIRTPDYKDKVVFGVPLLLVLQRTGQPLPLSIQAAIHYLRKTALDSTGLFRKSGVRSRIQKLRNLNESNPKHICYDDQQAYDVADMLKQYFRELPEALMTNKLSETFISIFQYIPEELRLEAIQAAILLMPDENREVLQSLLSFLLEVCEHSGENQMTANNLAVCFAPSLFHLSTPRSASASPRRRKTVGVPDLRELNENRAAYECLSSMVINYKELFSISEEVLSQCRLSCMDDCEPATLEELSTMVGRGRSGWKAYIDSCIQVLVKEAKEKFRGWMSVSQSDGVELSYRKVGDGHPLRLWKVSTEVEAPPVELLNRILWERHTWDTTFLKWRVLQRLEKQTEVFQYASSSLAPHPPCDYCVLRSWKTDLPKGACVLIEVSVEHPDAHLMIEGVRAVILASRFLIEPCGSGKSRITHISRVDTRGRSTEWYNRAYGHICTLQMIRLRDSFSHSIRAEGPETKV